MNTGISLKISFFIMVLRPILLHVAVSTTPASAFSALWVSARRTGSGFARRMHLLTGTAAGGRYNSRTSSLRDSPPTPATGLRLASSSHENSNGINNTVDKNESKELPTVQQVWQESLSLLNEHGISEPEWSTAHLLADAMRLPWEAGFSRLLQQQTQSSSSSSSQPHSFLTMEQYTAFQALLQRRLKDEPLQYILGRWDFLDYSQLIVRPPLLCPRPETEELVELVRKDILRQQQEEQANSKSSDSNVCRILDVGCGTGVIGIALADRIPSTSVVAIDVEPIAVETSLENAQLVLGSNNDDSRYTALLCSAQDYQAPCCFDAIVSNPPYIPRADMATLAQNIVAYESDQALCGGDDGMDVIKTILTQWANHWGCRRSSSGCWMEVDPTHPELIQRWLQEPEQSSLATVIQYDSTFKDLSGRDRFVKLKFR